MKYTELKEKHAKELNDFKGIFFAFSNKQFDEGMQKIGLTKDDTKKVCSFGMGGFILRERSKAFNDMFKRNKQELKELKKQETFLLEALVYELNNYEYSYTGDASQALEALNINIDTIDKKLFKKALQLAS